MRTAILYLIPLMCFKTACAQDYSNFSFKENSFYAARDLAYSGQHDRARDTLHHILDRYPASSDVRNLLARTYSWDGRFQEARRHFNKITSEERNNKEAWLAAVKNEIYAENYGTALGLTNKALFYLPGDQELVLLQADIVRFIYEQHPVAKDPEPEHPETKSENRVAFPNRLGLLNDVAVFDRIYEPMFSTSLEYIREGGFGKLLARVNYAHRFAINGMQYELDLYPKLSKTFYAYLNYGFSESAIYPAHRAGVELYANLPKALEVSAGLRYLVLQEADVNILTGSLGLYSGNYYYSLRPYITPRTGEPTSYSGTFTLRRYLKDAENYLGLLVGVGYSPEIRQLLTGDTLVAETLLFVESQQMGLEYQFNSTGGGSLYKASLGLSRQELLFAPDEFFWSVSAGLRYHFGF